MSIQELESPFPENTIPVPIGDPVITHSGKIIQVVEQRMLIGSTETFYERARRSPGTRLLITSPNNRILLTREYRDEVGGWDYRLPGGKVFDILEEYSEAIKNGEDILEKSKLAAQKEAQEEVGINAEDITHLYTSKLGATVEWDLYYFRVNLPTEELGEQKLEPGENIQVGWYSPTDALSLALDGSLSEDRSAAVLMRYILNRQSALENEDTNKQAGQKLIDLIQQANLNTLRLRRSNLATLEDIESVIFVGSSFVGKTTLVDVIREAVKEDPDTFGQLCIPKRIITRPQRQNDNLVENEFRTLDEFREMVVKGEIGMHWIRRMEGTRTEQYGFLPVEPGTIPIYSANNAVINNRESVEPNSLLEKSLIVAIYAPEDIRRKRLFERSPDLVNDKPEEVAYRLEDRATNMYPDAHIVVKNFGRYELQTKDDIVALMKLISQAVTQ